MKEFNSLGRVARSLIHNAKRKIITKIIFNGIVWLSIRQIGFLKYSAMDINYNATLVKLDSRNWDAKNLAVKYYIGSSLNLLSQPFNLQY